MVRIGTRFWTAEVASWCSRIGGSRAIPHLAWYNNLSPHLPLIAQNP